MSRGVEKWRGPRGQSSSYLYLRWRDLSLPLSLSLYPSFSISPSLSQMAGSLSPSLSVSLFPSLSISPSLSQMAGSLSPSLSVSLFPSLSISPSLSQMAGSLSPSLSVSLFPSLSISPSLSQMAGSLSPSLSLSLSLPISLHLCLRWQDLSSSLCLSISLNLSISISDSLPTVLSLRLPPFLVISFSSFSHALSYIFLPLSMFSFSSRSSPLSLYSLSFETGQRLGGLEFPCSQTRGLPAMSIHLMPDRHSLFLRVSSRQEKSNQGKLPAWLFYRPLLFNFWGNSLETPNVWGLSSFHPNVSKQPPPPQCLGFCLLFTPRLLSRRAGSDVDATAAAHRTRKPRQHRESRRLHQFPALPGQPLPLPTDPTGLNPPRWSLPVPILPFPPLPPVPQLPAFPGFPPIPFFKPWKMLLHFLLYYMFSFGELSMTFFKQSSTVCVFFDHSLIFVIFIRRRQ